MIDAAERQGVLKPGGTIVEATAGNTGLALALVGALKGYRTLLVVPDKMSREKIMHLKALGAEVVMTRSDVGKGHPAYYQDLAQRLAAERPTLVRESICQSRQSRGTCAHDRSGNLGADGRARRRGRLRRGQRRHDHRSHALLPLQGPTGEDDSRRPAGLGARRIHALRAASARWDRGRSRASARTSCRRSPISPA
jgi:hypothetical protein